ncbi:hypothetical protein GCM10008985_09630 [Halococcus dombrowskii]|uniref:Transposase n=1 Tax=Halococcus dombrowskii TaxID=179637 RepID=A0AAV3SD96_HALDO
MLDLGQRIDGLRSIRTRIGIAMTAYRFRVKFDPDPTSLWRDVVVGADSTIVEFQSVISGFHL